MANKTNPTSNVVPTSSNNNRNPNNQGVLANQQQNKTNAAANEVIENLNRQEGIKFDVLYSASTGKLYEEDEYEDAPLMDETVAKELFGHAAPIGYSAPKAQPIVVDAGDAYKKEKKIHSEIQIRDIDLMKKPLNIQTGSSKIAAPLQAIASVPNLMKDLKTAIENSTKDAKSLFSDSNADVMMNGNNAYEAFNLISQMFKENRFIIPKNLHQHLQAFAQEKFKNITGLTQEQKDNINKLLFLLEFYNIISSEKAITHTQLQSLYNTLQRCNSELPDIQRDCSIEEIVQAMAKTIHQEREARIWEMNKKDGYQPETSYPKMVTMLVPEGRVNDLPEMHKVLLKNDKKAKEFRTVAVIYKEKEQEKNETSFSTAVLKISGLFSKWFRCDNNKAHKPIAEKGFFATINDLKGTKEQRVPYLIIIAPK